MEIQSKGGGEADLGSSGTCRPSGLRPRPPSPGSRLPRPLKGAARLPPQPGPGCLLLPCPGFLPPGSLSCLPLCRPLCLCASVPPFCRRLPQNGERLRSGLLFSVSEFTSPHRALASGKRSSQSSWPLDETDHLYLSSFRAEKSYLPVSASRPLLQRVFLDCSRPDRR